MIRFIQWLQDFGQWAERFLENFFPSPKYDKDPAELPMNAVFVTDIKPTPEATQTPEKAPQSVATPNPDYLIPDWTSTVSAHHNVRVLSDLEGLDYEQKQVLTACVMVESGFEINAEHKNYAYHEDGTRYLSSTDFGIVQVNDYWHIGPHKDFPSIDYVLTNPEECVRWMCRYYKQNNHLNPWVSYKSGAYMKWYGRV